jgi:hypothetical protein
MKWVNGYTLKEKVRRYNLKQEKFKKWHDWFAWDPVVVGTTEDEREIKVWLQTVRRKGTFHEKGIIFPYWTWEYKEIERK